MEAHVNGANLKLFNHALDCLATFGENLFIRVMLTEEMQSMRLCLLNSAMTAFCAFYIHEPFFDLLQVQDDSGQVECQINIKALQSILSGRSNRHVEKVEFKLVNHNIETLLAVRLHCQHGVIKTHKLRYEPKTARIPSDDPNPRHHMVIPPRIAQCWIDQFLGPRTGEITLMATPVACLLKSLSSEITSETSHRGNIKRAIATEIRPHLEEFETYDVSEETIITFSMKEFKAAIVLAEQTSTSLEVRFSAVNSPLFVHLTLGDIAAEIALTTRSIGDSPTQSGSAGSSAIPAATTRTPVAASNNAIPVRTAPQTTPTPRNEYQRATPRVSNPSSRPSQRQSTRASSSVPLATMRQSAQHLPLESTPRSPLQEPAESNEPLFFPSQDGQTRGEARAGLIADDDWMDDIGDRDFDAMEIEAAEALEKAIERGDTEIRGSQTSVRGATQAGQQTFSVTDPAGKGAPPTEPQSSAAKNPEEMTSSQWRFDEGRARAARRAQLNWGLMESYASDEDAPGEIDMGSSTHVSPTPPERGGDASEQLHDPDLGSQRTTSAHGEREEDDRSQTQSETDHEQENDDGGASEEELPSTQMSSGPPKKKWKPLI